MQVATHDRQDEAGPSGTSRHAHQHEIDLPRKCRDGAIDTDRHGGKRGCNAIPAARPGRRRYARRESRRGTPRATLRLDGSRKGPVISHGETGKTRAPRRDDRTMMSRTRLQFRGPQEGPDRVQQAAPSSSAIVRREIRSVMRLSASRCRPGSGSCRKADSAWSTPQSEAARPASKDSRSDRTADDAPACMPATVTTAPARCALGQRRCADGEAIGARRLMKSGAETSRSRNRIRRARSRDRSR